MNIWDLLCQIFLQPFKLKFNWSRGSKGSIQPFHIRAVGDEFKREGKKKKPNIYIWACWKSEGLDSQTGFIIELVSGFRLVIPTQFLRQRHLSLDEGILVTLTLGLLRLMGCNETRTIWLSLLKSREISQRKMVARVWMFLEDALFLKTKSRG